MSENLPIVQVQQDVPSGETSEVKTEAKDKIQQQFDDISEKIKSDPDTINRLNKHTLEDVDKYLYANKEKSTETLFNIWEAIKKPEL